MEKKSDDAIIGEYIDRIVSPIFQKAAQEIKKDPMWVGGVGQESKGFSYYQPHNIRRVFDFSHDFFSNRLYIKTHLKGVGLKLFNNGKELDIKNYMGCSIRIRKNTIQITNLIEHKRWYLINDIDAKKQILDITKAKELECVGVLKAFMNDYGGKSEFRLVSAYTEPKIKANVLTEELPENELWHEKHHKKVYREKEIELYDINNAIKLIDESIFFRHEPMIAENLRNIYLLLQGRESKGSLTQGQVMLPDSPSSDSGETSQIPSLQELLNLGLEKDIAQEYREFMKEMRA